MRPTPASRARASSATVLLLPCMVMISPGRPADSAVSSSPSVQTSTPSPSWAAQRSTSRQQNALAA